MTKFYNYLNESKKFILTIKDIERAENSVIGSDEKFKIDFLLDYWHEGNKKEVQGYLQTFSKAVNKTIKILEKKSKDDIYVNKKQTMLQFFDYEDFPIKSDEYFPIIIYISSFPDDENTIGLIVHKNGKVEEFEGNDEAHYKTYELVDDIMGNSNKPVTVYGNHTLDLVRKIEETKTLPKGLYMSPIKKYAEGYWSTTEERIMFSCEAIKSDFIRESEYDWKTKEKTKIKKFKYQ